MGSVEKRIRDGKVTYLARWRDDAHRQRKRSFTRKVDADRFLAQVEADIVRGQYVDPSDKTTVVEYARRWAAGRAHRPTTARRVSSLIETHIAATPLGSRRLAAVVPSEVQAWAADRGKVLSPSTLRNLVGLLRSVYAAAVLDRLVGRSPVVRVSLPSAHRERVVPLTVDQVRKLADAIPARNRAMVLTQAGLGLRLGELLALRVQDVDFAARLVRIEWQFAPQSKVRTVPKTPRSRRTVPLPQVVADALRAHMAQFPPADDGTLFTTRFAGPYRHDYYGSIIFGAAVQKAGLPESITTHDLRHHYASVLLMQGESVITVAERLGHENATLVLSTYGHLMPDSEERTRRAVDEAWGCAPDAPQGETPTL
ncbi:tyrosine-type recombinase/integrase [Micromonospora tulbaghiae]|uniref:tyrosine-type recombinase/integrase n=1 Tax=Micromonospora TaxID=1873 RepID=UPI0001BF4779|nr:MULTISPECIES: site-specific integrase [Micromonospora]ADL48869.1 integrase family protein [Micromonospora aurantiaca ATCC 27029]OHX05760.1 integrase [Micromonospora sp. WMMB235]